MVVLLQGLVSDRGGQLGEGCSYPRNDPAHHGRRRELPIGRVVGPADVAALAIHLMTNTALTGATYEVEGGQQLTWTAQRRSGPPGWRQRLAGLADRHGPRLSTLERDDPQRPISTIDVAVDDFVTLRGPDGRVVTETLGKPVRLSSVGLHHPDATLRDIGDLRTIRAPVRWILHPACRQLPDSGAGFRCHGRQLGPSVEVAREE